MDEIEQRAEVPMIAAQCIPGSRCSYMYLVDLLWLIMFSQLCR
ncbi:hypothetical protein [Mycobacterium sp. URHB0044]|nr:hypothetical protein [Mycobacterium sp. URHB0044]